MQTHKKSCSIHILTWQWWSEKKWQFPHVSMLKRTTLASNPTANIGEGVPLNSWTASAKCTVVPCCPLETTCCYSGALGMQTHGHTWMGSSLVQPKPCISPFKELLAIWREHLASFPSSPSPHWDGWDPIPAATLTFLPKTWVQLGEIGQTNQILLLSLSLFNFWFN